MSSPSSSRRRSKRLSNQLPSTSNDTQEPSEKRRSNPARQATLKFGSNNDQKENKPVEKQKPQTATIKTIYFTGIRYTHDTPPTPLSPEASRYMKASPNQRKELLKLKATVVSKHRDTPLFREMFSKFRDLWQQDPVLRDNWSNKIELNATGSASRFDYLMTERISEIAKKSLNDPQGRVQFEVRQLWFRNYFEKQKYNAPKTRILIHPNITHNEEDVVPVFSDINGEKLEDLEISNGIVYEYGEANRFDAKEEPDLEKALVEGEKEQNLIRCNCCKPGRTTAMIPCYQNENCPCYKMNKDLQKLQDDEEDNGRAPTEFTTHKPILFKSAKGPYFKNVGFACSASCACKGNCSNNALYLAQKRKIPLEIYRANEVIGFGLRSPVAIPAGTPIIEFIGEIQQENKLPEDSHDYAYNMGGYEDDWKFMKLAQKIKNWTPEYAKLLKKMNKTNYHCNPKWYGNAARTALHSCIANVEIVRVYQKSLSPAHMKLVMVAIEDIYPGYPITLDYGQEYVKQQLKNACQCGTFACCNRNNRSEFAGWNGFEISSCLAELHVWKNNEYLEKIVNWELQRRGNGGEEQDAGEVIDL